MRLRLGVRATQSSGRQVVLNDSVIGVDLAWVEIDGHRATHVVSARTKLKRGAHLTEVTYIGAAEIVYLDRFGGEMGDGPSPEWVQGIQDGLDDLTQKLQPGRLGRHEKTKGSI